MKVLNVLAIATTAVLAAAGPVFADASSVQLPEPGTLALLVGGVATALLIRHRKK
jgi:hypothetical protein